MPSRSLLVALLACLTLAAPTAAPAQQEPFTPLPPAPQQPAPPPAPAPSEDDGLSSGQQLLIALAGIVLLVGIAWAIVRDARHRAPVEQQSRDADGMQRSKGTRAPPVRRAKQSRQKARAARQARKRNR